MAKVKIQGHASGTGILTVTAPNTSSDRTITLPDATGTLLNSDGSAASLTAIPAANITGTLPAISATNLTNVPAANITGTLPAISGASLTGFTASQMPAGSVVQYGFATNGDYLDLSDTSWVSSGITTEFTPLLSSSKLIVWGIVISSMWNITNRGTSVKMKIKVEDTYLSQEQTQTGAQHTGQTHAMTAAQTQMGVYTNSDTTAKTCEIWVKNEDGDYCNASINQYPGYSQLLIMEVAV